VTGSFVPIAATKLLALGNMNHLKAHARLLLLIHVILVPKPAKNMLHLYIGRDF
jgi:hypothetical protein